MVDVLLRCRGVLEGVSDGNGDWLPRRSRKPFPMMVSGEHATIYYPYIPISIASKLDKVRAKVLPASFSSTRKFLASNSVQTLDICSLTKGSTSS